MRKRTHDLLSPTRLLLLLLLVGNEPQDEDTLQGDACTELCWQHAQCVQFHECLKCMHPGCAAVG
jgi:hypothetical protein